MVYRIIWAAGVASRGVEAAMGYEKLPIVTTKKIYKKNINRRQPNKANSMEESYIAK